MILLLYGLAVLRMISSSAVPAVAQKIFRSISTDPNIVCLTLKILCKILIINKIDYINQ